MNILRKILLVMIGLGGTVAATLLLIWNNTPKPADQCKLPLIVSPSGIMLEALQGYDGPYFEDRSDEPVCGIAAGIFVNNGSQCIESAYIEVHSQSSKYVFEICMLPPGMRVLVLDANKSIYTDAPIINCYAQSKFSDDAFNGAVTIGMIDGSCRIVNIGKSAISLSVYHRVWNEKEGIYVGGIAYKTHVDDLQPGDQLMIKPGYSFPYESKVIYAV